VFNVTREKGQNTIMIDNQLILEALTSGSGFLVFFFMARIMSDSQL